MDELLYGMDECPCDPGDAPADEPKKPGGSVLQLGATLTKGPRGTIYCITVIGQVEGHYLLSPSTKTTKYEHILPQLVAVEESGEVDGLLVLLNTVGGDVEAGLAIAELIATMEKPTVSVVLGGGHSIGVPLAVAADMSFIVPSATMTIHPVRMTGMLIGTPATFSYLEKMQERIVRFVTDHSGITAARYRELMFRMGELAGDVGTVLYGEDAVKEGVIDRVGGLGGALEALYAMIGERRRHHPESDDPDSGEPDSGDPEPGEPEPDDPESGEPAGGTSESTQRDNAENGVPSPDADTLAEGINGEA